ncbi:redoxin [Aphanothece hegewaldii CCALA 016]|uniref:Redoxin n=1 Tax=Aphanothece hegewaldii CCALA 016 TaxID=2107694 RepID=A0A2T1M2E0_9CHRO|nr:thioredoxin family protein [Aphanothece hegewaldii]PSF38926.1 redoxin [Aphanothece hegewaldii CCALA 016]
MNKHRLRRKLLMSFGLGMVGVGATSINFGGLKKALLTDDYSAIAMTSPSNTLPEFQGINEWLNSDPLTTTGLKGNVILVQFWTFACINCQRTLPYITQWHQKYAAQGLKVIGIHTPEFAFERDTNNVKKAMRQNQITYPVAMDNAYKTWQAYDNKYWPHLYLADRRGVLRYDHIGEGAYDKTEQTIRQLLNEKK